MQKTFKISDVMGKMIGTALGVWVTHSIIGALVGLWLGHVIDKARRLARVHPFMSNTWSHTSAQQAFFDATFAVMGHIAKADGHVSAAEIQIAERFMVRMRLSAEQKQAAVACFNQGKQADFDLQTTLQRLREACRGNMVLLQLFIDIQTQTAQVDGLSQQKTAVLQTIIDNLGVNTFFSQFFKQAYGQAGAGQRQAGTCYQTTQDPYAVLGIKAAVSDSEVKRAYRKLMSENHPDKLVAQGLPEEMIKLATEKTQTIQAAYEQIREQRGMKR